MEELNRNTSRIYEVDGSKVVSKTHQKPIFLKREEFFYDLFQRIPLVRTPQIYRVDGLELQTSFIETGKKDVGLAVREWAKVHSYFLENPLDNKIFIHHDIREVSSYVFENLNLFHGLSSLVKRKLSEVRLNRELKTLLHGDLQQKNMVTFKGQNYYFDFELGGLGHPARDVASIIISSPEKKEEIISNYKESIKFSYDGIVQDINSWLMARASQLYILFEKREDGTFKQKKAIKKKLADILRED
ncbi:MAG: hypothetical protein WC494_03195 [Candidatus Pacearchaeota archaeon]